MSNDMTIYRAFLAARSCGESLLTAHHVDKEDASYYVDYAITEARRMADILGYDLVKREAVKVEEAA